MVFDRKRPGMGKGSAAAQPDVLDRKQKFPGREDLRIFAPRRQEGIDAEDGEVGRNNAQGAPGKKPSEFNVPATGQWRQELAADEVAAENEEKVDSDPTKTIEATGRFETEERGVIDRDHDDGQGAKKIETGLAFTIGETRIDFGRKRSEVRSQRSDFGIRRNPLPNYRERVRQRVRVIS